MRNTGDASSLLVDDDRRERAVEHRDHHQTDRAERRNEREVAARDGEDRPEQVLEEVDVERADRRDEHDPCRDPRVEDERERLVARGPAAAPQHLDRDAAENRGRERGQHRRHVEQEPGRGIRVPGDADCGEDGEVDEAEARLFAKGGGVGSSKGVAGADIELAEDDVFAGDAVAADADAGDGDPGGKVLCAEAGAAAKQDREQEKNGAAHGNGAAS